jgi:ferredoxin
MLSSSVMTAPTVAPASRRAPIGSASASAAPATSRALALAAAVRGGRSRGRLANSRAAPPETEASPQPAKPSSQAQQQPSSLVDRVTGLGDALGPIGMTYGGGSGGDDNSNQGPAARKAAEMEAREREQQRRQQQQQSGGGAGVALGPISLSFGGDGGVPDRLQADDDDDDASTTPQAQSIASMTTAEWRARYEREDGTVDLWLEDEFNAGSRLVGGRAAHFGRQAGLGTGEGPSLGGEDVAVHRVVIRDPHYGNAEFDIEVPEDRYVLFEAEAQGLQLPYACRMGCCTACAVRVLEGELRQPEALGVSAELRREGYALMCVAYPTADCVIETVSEDEIYEKQFGRAFAEQALDPNNPAYVARDDFALEVAMGDE